MHGKVGAQRKSIPSQLVPPFRHIQILLQLSRRNRLVCITISTTENESFNFNVIISIHLCVSPQRDTTLVEMILSSLFNSEDISRKHDWCFCDCDFLWIVINVYLFVCLIPQIEDPLDFTTGPPKTIICFYRYVEWLLAP